MPRNLLLMMSFFYTAFVFFLSFFIVSCGGGSILSSDSQKLAQLQDIQLPPKDVQKTFVKLDPKAYGNVYFHTTKKEAKINPDTQEGEILYDFVYFEGLESGYPFTVRKGGILFFYVWLDGSWVQKEARLIDSHDASADTLIARLCATISALPDDAFDKNPQQRRNALYNKCEATSKQIANRDFQGANEKLKNDMLQKVDGSKNSWIVSSKAQNQLMSQINDMLFILGYLLAKIKT